MRKSKACKRQKIFPFIIQQRPQIASYLCRVSVIREREREEEAESFDERHALCFTKDVQTYECKQTYTIMLELTHINKDGPNTPCEIQLTLSSDPLNASLPLPCNTRPSRHFITANTHIHAEILNPVTTLLMHLL